MVTVIYEAVSVTCLLCLLTGTGLRIFKGQAGRGRWLRRHVIPVEIVWVVVCNVGKPIESAANAVGCVKTLVKEVDGKEGA